ncbi:MAG: hypothetical protein HYR91_11575 [Flavobacteriia bacterium]|nr:hypothetical protein [Flavobacteriia bacterium]
MIIVLTLFLNCIGDGMTDGQRKWYASLKPNQPTVKELKFADSLKTLKYSKIKYTIPVRGQMAYGFSSYYISLECPYLMTFYNKDSIKKVNLQIATELYSKVIADSILYDILDVNVIFHLKSKDLQSKNIELRKQYRKKILEQYSGFKIIQVDDTTYQRVKLK